MKFTFVIIFLLNSLMFYSATYTVTSTANGTTIDGVSLRWAITQANGNAGADLINFNLGAGPHTIALTAALPSLTDNSGVTIDGWDNSGNNGTQNSVAVFDATTSTPMNPSFMIILGNSASVTTGLVLASNNNIIKGLVLQNFGDGTVGANDIAITISGNTNQILGCYIGMDAAGTTKGTKTYYGIYISGNNNSIGDGSASGANLISGMNNNGYGIYITGAGATGNVIKGNMIGLKSDGVTAGGTSSNQYIGIMITSSVLGGNTIGGSVSGYGNVISGNGIGLRIESSTNANTVYGNIIGPRANGTTVVSSNPQSYGIFIDYSPNNIIGGSTSLERNVVSANTSYGIYLRGATTNVIKGNYAGINKNGTAIISGSTQTDGISLWSSSDNNIIGGSAAGEANVVSGNTDRGVYVSSSTGNVIKGNIIGGQADGLTALASSAQFYGVEISSAPNNTVGGSAAGEKNYIFSNTLNGVYVIGAAATGNKITYNHIWGNSGIPIDLVGGGNSSKASPSITEWSTSQITGTSGANNVVEIFKNNTGSNNDAKEFLGTVTADASGNWTFTVPRSMKSLSAGEYILSTARDASNNTSESTAVKLVTLPIEIVGYSVQCSQGLPTIKWSTYTETNNDYFTIERTTDGINDKKEFIVDGAGNSSQIIDYSYVDSFPLETTAYYRLKQTDFDGEFEYFDFVSILCEKSIVELDFDIFPNPNSGNVVNISFSGNINNEVLLVVYDITGRQYFSKVILTGNGQNYVSAINLVDQLSTGIYYIVASSNDKLVRKKLVVE